MSLPERIEAAIDKAVLIATEARDHGNGAWPLTAEQVLRAAEVDLGELHVIMNSGYELRLLPILLGRLAARYGVDVDG